MVASAIATCAITATTFTPTRAQPVAPAPAGPTVVSDSLRVGGDTATSWVASGTRVVLVERDARITGDGFEMSADKAVLWITPAPDARTYRVEASLLGNAKVVRGDVVREGGTLFVTASIRPDIQLTAANLLERDRSEDPIYAQAVEARGRTLDAAPVAPAPAVPVAPNVGPGVPGVAVPPGVMTDQPAGPVATEVRPRSPVVFQSDAAEMALTPDNKLAIVLRGNVLLLQTQPNGDRVEIQGDSAVLFTSVTNLKGRIDDGSIRDVDPAKDIEAAYIDGDARMTFTPQDKKRASEQRLRASRLYYDFQIDRAMLTDAVFQTTDPGTQLPLVIRAESIRRTATNEYEATHARFSTSSLAKPEFALGATKINVRQEDTGDVRLGTRTVYHADNVTFRTFDVPFFWLPVVGGSMTEGGGAMRRIGFSSTRGFGFGFQTVWGLFETLGQAPPRGMDATYRLDYFASRGFAGGIDASYTGSSISEDTRQPSSYDGQLSAYFARDFGTDRLGGDRNRIDWGDDSQEATIRGQAFWRHQQFFDERWQLQAQLGYLTDPTFREEWYEDEFNNGLPIENSLYVKRQEGPEVLSFFASYDVSGQPSVADELQELGSNGEQVGPLLINRMPEVQYHRIGQPIGDGFTLHSNNTLGVVQFSASRANARGGGRGNLGLRNQTAGANSLNEFAGIPSYGYTGSSSDTNFRADFRQELSYPLQLGPVKAVPYAMVRYTGETESPDGSNVDRIMAGVGLRLSTQLWRNYDDVRSELFDLNRIRHIVEPQANLFASAANADRSDFFIYDESIEGVSDVQMAQFAVRQTWQTKRGAPGRQRTVDVLSLNAGVNLFGNQPDELTDVPTGNLNGEILTPLSFRSLAFTSLPEASLARSGLFADLTWRVTDTTALLMDANYNFDSNTLATTSIGLAVSRDPRVRYFMGVRYIGEINSTIATFAMNYQISAKYSLGLIQSIQLTDGQNQNTSITLNRKFQQFTFSIGAYYDPIDDTGGFSFAFIPNGLGRGISSSELSQ